jgi:HD superfamily phosphohydrolase
VNVLEAQLLDSPPMQRLRRVRQLGTTHLVYPAATHSRLSHALGALRAAQDLLDAVADNRTGPRHTPDLLDEWDKLGSLPDGTPVLAARFAEATVLARLGALLHDFCHVPLGHTIEDDLKVLVAHDGNAPRFNRLWKRIDEPARRPIERGASRFPESTPLTSRRALAADPEQGQARRR